MSVTNAHTFGLAVLTDMGSPDGFTSHPLIKSALALSAARSYQHWLDLGTARTGVTAETFAGWCVSEADNEDVAADPAFVGLGWHTSALRDTFRASAAAALTANRD